MENGGEKQEVEQRWRFGANEALSGAGGVSIHGTLNKLFACVEDKSALIRVGYGDPSVYPSFRTTQVVEEAVVEAVRSAEHNRYSPTVGVPSARRTVAEYLSKNLPSELSPDDVFLTSGCVQAVEVMITVLARPGANILLPRPGFPLYEARCGFSGLEMRHFDLIPEKGWELDLDQVERLADQNTVAIVVINPCNPCGNVLTYEHMEKCALSSFNNLSVPVAFTLTLAVTG
ncbi:hypothetical protein LUZ60_007044 [Juncus effusus]|nr:hypothetical protein LUZ60_007044 [Juncus effusus]